ncbi:MAG: hypothetical protein JST66_12620 [Bacteroidetes bacterium]|nr:hypothetical protein [Bacteroidota bacterium]
MDNALPLHVCVDQPVRTVPAELSEQALIALYNAFTERADNLLHGITPTAPANGRPRVARVAAPRKALVFLRKAQGVEDVLAAGDGIGDDLQRLLFRHGKRWAPGKELRVRFLEGTPLQKAKVQQYAGEWSKHANIRFTFVEAGEAEVRVAFRPGLGSWSAVGTDCLSDRRQHVPTMNFGWFDAGTTEEEYRRTIVHEFGHAIGCEHEQANPHFGFTWNKPYVYWWYKKYQGWDPPEVDSNVFRKYPEQEVDATAFDSRSIMQYPIPKEFTVEGIEIDWNTELSPTDIAFAQEHYPF